MSNSVKIAALSALVLVAAGSVANAAPPPGKHQALSHSNNTGNHSFRPFQHQSGSNTGSMKPPGSHQVFVSHCDPGPCKGKPNKESHHRPPHWPPFGHHQHVEYRERYVYGYRPGGYERPSYAPQPSYVQPGYAPRPSTTAYAPAPVAQAPAASCLSKEYLNNGPVLFKDTCTKEWAMGEASPTRGVNVGCLRKEYVDGGAVKFSDVCTKEWATNTPSEQQAKAPAAQEEEDDDAD